MKRRGMAVACSAALWLTAPPLSHANPAQAGDATFREALAQAYLTNPQIGAQRQRLRETDEGLPKALSGWRPRVFVQGSIGPSAVFDSFDRAHWPERRLPDTAGIALTQPIYTSGRVHARVRQAEALVVAGRAALQASEGAVLLAAATAYLDVARDERVLALNRNQEAVLERTWRASEQELAAGAITQTDVEQARARLADQRGQVASAEAALGASRARFERETGQQAGELAMPAPFWDLPKGLAAALALVADNFDVLASQAAEEASRRSIDIARAGLGPQISAQVLGATENETDVQRPHQRDTVAEATVQLSIPLYQGGEQAAEIRQAKEASARTRLETEDVRRRARAQVQSAWSRLEGARQQQEDYAISERANVIVQRGIARQQSVGARTLIEVLNAQQEHLAAEVNVVSAERDAGVAGAELLLATGRLSAQGLGLDVPYYDPVSHYRDTRNRWSGTDPPP